MKRTARSFGGLRMTEKRGASSTGIHHIFVILRPPKDLAVALSHKDSLIF